MEKLKNQKIKIAQISDIHWRGQQRHDEYTNAFETLFSQLKENHVDAIICTGDIFHTKTENITPEVIDKFVWMIRNLQEIAPLHMILGNHDGNLANDDRQDAISPLLNAMNNQNVWLYKKSGIYKLITKKNETYNQTAWLYVYSLFDKDGWQSIEPNREKGFFDIALFHGSITGCETDGDFKMTECDLGVSFFEKYDLALLGDIHKQQYLGWRGHGGSKDALVKPWIGYPGSLIQQNYGELEKKGWYLWTLNESYSAKDWDVDFIEIPNKMPFVTISWLGTVEETVKKLLEDRNNNIKNHRIRISRKENISQLEITQLYRELKTQHGACEVTFKQDKLENIETVQTETVSISKHSLRNDIEALYKLYEEYLSISKEKHSLSLEQTEKAKEYISKYIKILNNNPEEDTVRDVVWSIKGMEFSNLYRYGEDNKINFQNLSGIVGVFGPNRLGKSSIAGSLMYALYNTTDRESVKSAQIINRKKKEGSAKVLFNVGGNDYLLQRKTVKSGGKKKAIEEEDKALTSLQLDRLSLDGNIVSLTSENDVKRSDTDKIVRRLIGTADDFLTTAFANQGGINRFIQAGPTTRKEILNRFLDLDIFKKLFTFANDDYKTIEIKTSHFDLANWETSMFDLQKRNKEIEELVDSLQITLNENRLMLEEKKIWLKQNENLNQSDLTKKLKLITDEIFVLDKEVQKIKKNLTHAINEKEVAIKSLEELKKTLFSENVDELQNNIKTTKLLRQNFNELKFDLSADKQKVETMKKSIRKLDLVPCGDSYPDCHYIKDSHIDKANIKKQEEIIEKMETTFREMENVLKAHEISRYEERLKQHSENKQKDEILKQKIFSLTKEIELLNDNLSKTMDSFSIKNNLSLEIQSKINPDNQKIYEENLMEVKNINKIISSIESNIQSNLIQIGVTKNKISQMEKDKIEVKQLLQELKIIDSVKEAFSKNGLPALVLKTQLPAINLELEKILGGIVDFKIILETELNSVNTLDVYIEDKHSKRLIELASGMEKTIASFALRVALTNLSSLPKPDIFICDEGFEYLDAEGLVKCMELLSSIKDRFKAILIISHIPEIKEIADKIIEIKDKDGEAHVCV